MLAEYSNWRKRTQNNMPRLGQSGQATKDDNSTDTDSTANEPQADTSGIGLGPCLLGRLRDGRGGAGRGLLSNGTYRLVDGGIGVGS